MEPVDFVKKSIEREIEDYRRKHFNAYLQSIRVKAPADFKRHRHIVHDVDDGIFIGYDQYIFEVFGSPSQERAVRYDEDLDQVTILFGRHYSSVSSWLSLLKPLECFSKEERMRLQRDWWQENGMKFRFLELAEELRVNIYGYAFGTEIDAYPNNNEHPMLAGSAARHEARISKTPTVNLLLLNKFVYKEAKKTLALQSQFHLTSGLTATKFLLHGNYNSWVHHIVLKLSHIKFFAVFGTQKYGSMDGERRNGNDGLLHFSHLASLKLIIGPPAGVLSPHSSTDTACQVKIVDRILDVAWPMVRGQPVTVSGFVRPSQKEEFEAKAATARQRFLHWREWGEKQAPRKPISPSSRAVFTYRLPPIRFWKDPLQKKEYEVDVAAERALVKATEGPRGYKWPPRCTCPSPCSEEHWECIE